jgi:hypothetical protein
MKKLEEQPKQLKAFEIAFAHYLLLVPHRGLRLFKVSQTAFK